MHLKFMENNLEKNVLNEILFVSSFALGASAAVILTANDAISNMIQDYIKFDGYVNNSHVFRESIKYGLKVGGYISIASFGLLKSYFFLKNYSKNH